MASQYGRTNPDAATNGLLKMDQNGTLGGAPTAVAPGNEIPLSMLGTDNGLGYGQNFARSNPLANGVGGGSTLARQAVPGPKVSTPGRVVPGGGPLQGYTPVNQPQRGNRRPVNRRPVFAGGRTIGNAPAPSGAAPAENQAVAQGGWMDAGAGAARRRPEPTGNSMSDFPRPQQGSTSQFPTVASADQYASLPSGARYMDGRTGQMKVKK
jgi:hypothetical protein